MYPSVALVGVALLVAWMGNFDGGYFLGGWALPAIALAAATLLVSAVATFGGRELRWAVLALGLFTAYTAWTLASVLWSANKGAAWIGAGQTYLYLLAFLVTVALITMGASRRWVLAALVLGPAAIAALTLQALGSGAGALFDDNRLVGTVGYYNGEAAFLLASLLGGRLPGWVSPRQPDSPRAHPRRRGALPGPRSPDPIAWGDGGAGRLAAGVFPALRQALAGSARPAADSARGRSGVPRPERSVRDALRTGERRQAH